jgi:hypothetical protein
MKRYFAISFIVMIALLFLYCVVDAVCVPSGFNFNNIGYALYEFKRYMIIALLPIVAASASGAWSYININTGSKFLNFIVVVLMVIAAIIAVLILYFILFVGLFTAFSTPPGQSAGW